MTHTFGKPDRFPLGRLYLRPCPKRNSMHFSSRVLLFFCVLLCTTSTVDAAFFSPPVEAQQVKQFQELERANVEQKLGRKLTFKERLGLSIVRGKAKRQARRGAKIAAGGSPVDGYAVASLVCGILGLFTLFTAIPALVLGIISLGRFKRDPQYRSGKGMAIAGVVLGGLVLFAVLLIIGIVAATWGRE